MSKVAIKQDPERLVRIKAEVRKCDQEIDVLKAENMSRQQAVKQRRSKWLDQVADCGYTLAAFRHDLKTEDLEAKLEAHKEGAEADVVEEANLIRKVLGEFANTPLGRAATGEAPKTSNVTPIKGGKKKAHGAAPDMSKESKAEALNVGDDEGNEPDLRSSRQKEKEAARKEEVAQKLSGIKPLAIPPAAH